MMAFKKLLLVYWKAEKNIKKHIVFFSFKLISTKASLVVFGYAEIFYKSEMMHCTQTKECKPNSICIWFNLEDIFKIILY